MFGFNELDQEEIELVSKIYNSTCSVIKINSTNFINFIFTTGKYSGIVIFFLINLLFFIFNDFINFIYNVSIT